MVKRFETELMQVRRDHIKYDFFFHFSIHNK